MNLYTTLKELCLIPGISGREKNIRAAIAEKIAPFADEVRTDTLGNLIALKKGKTGEKKIMLCAHMDEIGYLANFIAAQTRPASGNIFFVNIKIVNLRTVLL